VLDWRSTLHTWRFYQVQSRVTQKLGQISKIRPNEIYILCRGKLPTPIVNGRGDSFWKWKDFRLSRARDLDLESGHTAYRRASLIDLYLHAKFHWNWRNVLWTVGRTPETGFIRSTLKSQPKHNMSHTGHSQAVATESRTGQKS